MDSEDHVLFRRGNALFIENNFAGALEPLHASLKLSPHSKTAQLLGECYLQLGQQDEAILYLAAAQGLGKRPQALYLLSQALLQKGLLEKAESAARTALVLLPHYEKARELLKEIERRINSAGSRTGSDEATDELS